MIIIRCFTIKATIFHYSRFGKIFVVYIYFEPELHRVQFQSQMMEQMTDETEWEDWTEETMAENLESEIGARAFV